MADSASFNNETMKYVCDNWYKASDKIQAISNEQVLDTLPPRSISASECGVEFDMLFPSERATDQARERFVVHDKACSATIADFNSKVFPENVTDVSLFMNLLDGGGDPGAATVLMGSLRCQADGSTAYFFADYSTYHAGSSGMRWDVSSSFRQLLSNTLLNPEFKTTQYASHYSVGRTAFLTMYKWIQFGKLKH